MRYSLMTPSEDGSGFYDPLSFPDPPRKATVVRLPLLQNDIERPDILFYNIYGRSDYGDVALTLAGVPYQPDLEPGSEIAILDKRDLSEFIYENTR